MKKLSSIYNFALAFILMTAFGASAIASAATGIVVAKLLTMVPSQYGIAFSGFITAGSEYNGKEMEDIIIRPFFLGQLPQEMGIRVISTVKSTIKLTFFNSKSKILKAYADGWQGGSNTTIKQKKLTLAEFKAEQEYSKQTYKGLIQENITDKGGIAQNDITGTTVHNAEIAVFMAGVKEDARRIFWLGDTAKKTLHASGYYTASADLDYNVINGIWKAIFGSAAAYATATNDQIRLVSITNSGIKQVDTVSMTGSSGTANITVNGVAYLATYASSTTVTATNFVTTNAAALLLRNVVVTSSAADIIFTAVLAGQPQLVTAAVNATGDLAGTVAHTTANTPAQDLTTDEAKSTLKSMYNNSSKVLKTLIQEAGANVRYYVTDTIRENYLDTLEGQVLESARTAMIDGVPRLTYRGIPLMPMNIDQHLLADFNEPYPHRAILTPADNLVMVVNGTGDFAETKFWFNPDLNVNRQRTQFEFGADFVLPELMTVAY